MIFNAPNSITSADFIDLTVLLSYKSVHTFVHIFIKSLFKINKKIWTVFKNYSE